jgi:hypothetical protein
VCDVSCLLMIFFFFFFVLCLQEKGLRGRDDQKRGGGGGFVVAGYAGPTCNKHVRDRTELVDSCELCLQCYL